MNWDDIGDAIQAAVANASGVTTIWKHQDVNAPLPDYVAISLGGIMPLGIDYLKTSQDLTRPAGEEVKLEIKGQREVPLEVECFTTVATSGKNLAALSLCARTIAGLLLPSSKGILQKQAISVFDFGQAQWIPDVPSTKFRGRAIATVRCYMRPPTVEEYVGYIARVKGTIYEHGTANGGTTGTVRAFDSG